MSEHFNLSEDVSKPIAEYVEGSYENSVFNYRSAGQIAKWFDRLFHPGIDWPYRSSRWIFAATLMEKLDSEGKLGLFFSKLLSFSTLRIEHKDKNDAEISDIRDTGIKDLNKFLIDAELEIKKVGNDIKLQKINSDLELIGHGGFADVYKLLGQPIAVKKLRDEFKGNSQIVSRFKHEFILENETLSDITGIIKVYQYDAKEISYTMEYCNMDLEKFIKATPINDATKIFIVLDVLEIIKQVHQRDVIHRDISPKNIFIDGQKILIADFGLGKDLHNERTLATYDTSGMGTLKYCDPRLFESLKNGDVQSDIFSLGKLINFIFTGDSNKEDHPYKYVVRKSIAENLERRYKTVQEMIDGIHTIQQSLNDSDYNKKCKDLISKQKYDATLNQYLLKFEGADLLQETCDMNFRRLYYQMIKLSHCEEEAYQRLSSVHNFLQGDTRHLDWSVFDGIAYLALYILIDKELCAGILNEISIALLQDVAVDRHRYAVQDRFIEYVDNGRINKKLVFTLYQQLK